MGYAAVDGVGVGEGLELAMLGFEQSVRCSTEILHYRINAIVGVLSSYG